jgi:hypothetical protein
MGLLREQLMRCYTQLVKLQLIFYEKVTRKFVFRFFQPIDS